MLTSRMGAGLTAGAVNAGSQEVQGRPFHWTDTGIAAAGGALGVGGGLGWNAAVGAAGGYWQAQIDNKIYPKEQYTDPFLNAVTSSITGAAGYKVGDKITVGLGDKMPGSLFPIIIGNMVGSGVSEGADAASDIIKDKSQGSLGGKDENK